MATFLVTVLAVIALLQAPLVSSASNEVVKSNSTSSLPAIEPLLNIYLNSLNTVYNLVLNALSSLDSIPAHLSYTIPIDVQATKASLLKLYLQALELVKFLESVPKDAKAGKSDEKLEELLRNVRQEIDNADDDDLGNELLPGMLGLVGKLVDSMLDV